MAKTTGDELVFSAEVAERSHHSQTYRVGRIKKEEEAEKEEEKVMAGEAMVVIGLLLLEAIHYWRLRRRMRILELGIFKELRFTGSSTHGLKKLNFLFLPF